jgi:hypothetical protein
MSPKTLKPRTERGFRPRQLNARTVRQNFLIVCLLHRLLGHRYEKGSTTIYQELEGRQDTALRHAAKLLTAYPHRRPIDDNPLTTVHLLVQELNKFRRA